MAGNEMQQIEGKKINNPYEMATTAASTSGPGTALAQSESHRAMIEVMTSFEVAKRFPRDPCGAMTAILGECCRPSLAEVAVYQFSKGGSSFSGPSIRLMEAIARGWKNIQFGFKVLERSKGRSSIQAFARDLETNTFIERTFDVRHWRDTKKGGYAIIDEREIYELEANMAQRRVRSCIIGLIPGDVIDAAVDQCDMTMQTNADTSPEGLKKLCDAFAAFKVNAEMIEARIQCKLSAIKPVQFASLRKIYTSLKEGMAGPADFFDVSLGAAIEDKKDGGPKQPDLAAEIDAANKKAADKEPVPVEQKANKIPAPVQTYHEKLVKQLLGHIAASQTETELMTFWNTDFSDDLNKLYKANPALHDHVESAWKGRLAEFRTGGGVA